MSSVIETIVLNKPAKLTGVAVSYDLVGLDFDGERVELEDFHSQDCCEQVYADWAGFKVYEPQLVNDNTVYAQIVIKGIDEGLLICFEGQYSSPLQRVFIPCYNEQNGYYSRNLELVVRHGVEKRIDISNFVEDNEY